MDDKFEVIKGITVKEIVPFINIAFVYSLSTVYLSDSIESKGDYFLAL